MYNPNQQFQGYAPPRGPPSNNGYPPPAAPPPPGQGQFMAPPPPTGYGAPPPPPQNNGIANQMGQMSLNNGMQPPPPMQQPPAPQMYSAPPAPPPPSQPTRAPAAPQFYQAPASMQSPQGVGGGGQFMSPGAPHSFQQQQQHSQAPYTGQPNPNPYANQQQAQQPYGGQRQAPAPAPAANVDYMAQVDLSIEVPKQFLRTTVSKIPTSSALASSSKLPIGGVIRPLAPSPTSTNPSDDGVSVINPAASGIIRCKRCRTYINPFVAWLENGRRWRCNICGQLNDVPSAYFCHLDEAGKRRDASQRPELSCGVVEYVAPAEYMVRPPQPPCYFFVIDVSSAAGRVGALKAIAEGIKITIDELTENPRTQIGFLTFDKSVHFYSLKSTRSTPEMMVVSDLKELFIPAPDDLLANLSDSRHVVDSFLESLPSMFSNNQGTESCLGPALKAAFTVCKAIGGKMCVFQSGLPNLSDGALKQRENPRIMGTSEEFKLLTPSINWYKDTAVEFSRSQICVEMFVFPHQYVDIATITELTKNTAGQLYTYPSFNYDTDTARFHADLQHALSRRTAFEAVMRVRCTRGMRIPNFYGNFSIRGQDLLALPNVTSDTCMGFDLVHDEPMLNTSVVCIQSALLYTSSEGERRIRVHTHALQVTSVLSDVVNSVDTDAVCNLLSKQALDLSLKSGLDTARMRLQQACIDIIKSAKGGGRSVGVYGANAHYPSQKKLQQDTSQQETPESLALLPLYTMALQKNIVFRGGADVHPDERASHMAALRGMWISDSRHFIYPRMFSVHDMDGRVGTEVGEGEDEDEDKVCGRNNILLPEVVDLSVENLKSDGIFLLDNSIEMYLWVGRAADASLLSSLFGTATLEGADMAQIKIVDGSDLASRLSSIISGLRSSGIPKLTIVREGDQMVEQRFFWHLVEDRASFHGTYSYADYMQLINSGGQQGVVAAQPVPNNGGGYGGAGGGGGMPGPPPSNNMGGGYMQPPTSGNNMGMGGPPRSGPPTNGGPPMGMGGGMGGPPTGMGGPPTGMGGPPTGMGGPPTGMGGPPTGMGGPPTGMGGPPTSGYGGPPQMSTQPPMQQQQHAPPAPPAQQQQQQQQQQQYAPPPTSMSQPPMQQAGYGAPPTMASQPPPMSSQQVVPPQQQQQQPPMSQQPPPQMSAPPTSNSYAMGPPPTSNF
ncbi:hypothetical protein TrCOL_g10240 [Triparma columacea]|uniref:Uncharacterized protein n=1 Tax=Triparma columacea TaxID=722753 RepID=A0A9W7GE06_9STRA|nr:hypothetical protein TrCOL_g10240 [Triparma columacea]